MIDCSIQAQDERRASLARLRAKLNSGLTSVSDRSRSVGYANSTALIVAIERLEREQAFCAGTPRVRRLSYVPLMKGVW